MKATITVRVEAEGKPHYETDIVVSATAMEQVRVAFNPSGSTAVDVAKLLCAAGITQMEHSGGGRLAAVAMTNLEQSAMWAVKALTIGK